MVKYRLTNFLICPACKHYPLKLNVIEVTEYKDREFKFNPCDLYCAYLDKYTSEMDEYPCDECVKKEITYGFYTCPNCDRWYPIVDGIAIMHIGRFRPKKVIKQFIEKYRDKIPEKYVERELLSK